ncbi:MAG: YggS family pyridoxal phosphate-dependent enzyme [Verrucomicrobiales bacterium]
MSSIADRLAEVQERIAAALQRVGRHDSAELVAVSKTFSPEIVREAAKTPHQLFGESRVQEALAKIPLCPTHLRWHLIGHLQSNKVRKILPLVEAVHSIDSLALAQDVDRAAAAAGRRVDVYLQVNVAEETAKHGFTADAVRRDLEALLRLERVNVVGLMTIPPFAPEAELSRRYFARLRELRDSLAAAAGTPLSGLSMGMSDDFEIALEEGATIVRVGSAIFGRRQNLIGKKKDD